MPAITNDQNHLFTLRVKVGLGSFVIIHAFDGGPMQPNHNRIDVEVRHNGEVIFPRGALYCGTPRCVDDDEAKDLVLSLVAMKPGDTDREYFEGYTTAQLEWVQRFGEEISLVRQDRYCDPETGEFRRPRRRYTPFV